MCQQRSRCAPPELFSGLHRIDTAGGQPRGTLLNLTTHPGEKVSSRVVTCLSTGLGAHEDESKPQTSTPASTNVLSHPVQENSGLKRSSQLTSGLQGRFSSYHRGFFSPASWESQRSSCWCCRCCWLVPALVCTLRRGGSSQPSHAAGTQDGSQRPARSSIPGGSPAAAPLD